MFTRAIVRRPCAAMIHGITSAPELGAPDYQKALEQHDAYICALQACGLEVTVLPADEAYPDSCFVEDTAVLTEHCAVLTRPGAPSRQRETESMLPVLQRFYGEDKIHGIQAPGTLEGGDVMRVGDHFYVGLSDRSNAEGIAQLRAFLEPYGLTVEGVEMDQFLHLKTGATYMERGNLLVAGEFQTHPAFAGFNRIPVPDEEAYGVNCIYINDKVIVPEGYPAVLTALREAGYETLTVDTGEYKKIDGGLTCLSLRF